MTHPTPPECHEGFLSGTVVPITWDTTEPRELVVRVEPGCAPVVTWGPRTLLVSTVEIEMVREIVAYGGTP